MLSSIIVGTVLIVFNDFFSQVFFNSKNFTNVILLLSVFILLENIFNNIYSYLRSMQEYYYQSMIIIYRTLFELIIVGGGIIYFHYIDELTLDIIFYLFFSSLLLTITIGYFLLHVKKLIIYTRPDFNFLREYLSFGLPQLPGSLSHWIMNLSDRLIIGFYLGIEALGIYFIANRIGMILTFPLTPLGTLLHAEGSKKHDNGECLDEKKILTLYSVFIVSFAIIVYCLAYNFIDYIIGEKYKETLDIVFLMMFSLTLLNIFSVLNIFDSVKKNSIKIGKIWTIIALINLGLNFYLIPSIGVIGAVYSSIISYSVGILLSTVYEK